MFSESGVNLLLGAVLLFLRKVSPVVLCLVTSQGDIAAAPAATAVFNRRKIYTDLKY